MDLQNLSLAVDRISLSQHRQHFRIGNPTIPRFGISELYDRGDGRRWFHKCSKCNERQPLDWFVNVIEQRDDGQWIPKDHERYLSGQGDLRPVCRRCRAPWDRTSTGGVWVPERPLAGRRSYTMSQLDVLSKSIRKLYSNPEEDDGWLQAQSSTLAIQRFHRSVLGKSYEPGGARVGLEVLQHAMTGPEHLDPHGGAAYADRLVVAGVDVGTLLNVQVDTIDRVTNDKGEEIGPAVRTTRWVGTVRTFEEVDSIIKRYGVGCLVIDAAPERRLSAALRDRMRGTCSVWLCQFHPTDRSGADDYGMRLDHRARVATVDRTQILDATLDDLRGGRHVLPQDVLTVDGFADQMGAPSRVLDEEKGRYIWSEGNKADHYRFSDSYARLAADLVQRGGRYEVVSTRPDEDEEK
jgi:hypothetical protein